MTILALDLGGSSSRARLRPSVGQPLTVRGPGLHVGPDGVGAQQAVDGVISSLDVGAGQVDAVGIGSSGILTLGAEPGDLAGQLRAVLGRVPIALASDAVTSTLGALGGRPGAVALVGTGATALGTDLAGSWHKVDGWGHVLGDAGSGAWIGSRALKTALEHHDHRRVDAAALLDAARQRFGVPESWPRQIYTRQDRAGVLASVVPDVVALAREGDEVSRDLLRATGHEIARSLLAALRPPVPALASWTGGVFAAGDLVLESLRSELTSNRSDVVLQEPQGDALDGAELLASQLLSGELEPHPPLLSVHPA